MYFLGIDAGTTGVTVGVYDADGNLVAKSYSEFETYYPNRDGLSRMPSTGGTAL